MPPLRAFPYPRCSTWTTLAPADCAMAMEPSVDPLSATITSPLMPACASVAMAFATQTPTVSFSFKQGRTTETSSGWPGAAGSNSAGTSWIDGFIFVVIELACRRAGTRDSRPRAEPWPFAGQPRCDYRRKGTCRNAIGACDPPELLQWPIDTAGRCRLDSRPTAPPSA